jgi:hypothetical protein
MLNRHPAPARSVHPWRASAQPPPLSPLTSSTKVTTSRLPSLLKSPICNLQSILRVALCLRPSVSEVRRLGVSHSARPGVSMGVQGVHGWLLEGVGRGTWGCKSWQKLAKVGGRGASVSLKSPPFSPPARVFPNSHRLFIVPCASPIRPPAPLDAACAPSPQKRYVSIYHNINIPRAATPTCARGMRCRM